MRTTSALLLATLMVTSVTSAAWAGTTGNGWAQRTGQQPAATTHYVFCYGANPHAAYFSPVFTTTTDSTSLISPFAQYLTQNGDANDGGQCITAAANADAVAEKKRRERTLRSKGHGHRDIVEVAWTGA